VSDLSVDTVTDVAGTGSPSFPNGGPLLDATKEGLVLLKDDNDTTDTWDGTHTLTMVIREGYVLIPPGEARFIEFPDYKGVPIKFIQTTEGQLYETFDRASSGANNTIMRFWMKCGEESLGAGWDFGWSVTWWGTAVIPDYTWTDVSSFTLADVATGMNGETYNDATATVAGGKLIGGNTFWGIRNNNTVNTLAWFPGVMTCLYSVA